MGGLALAHACVYSPAAMERQRAISWFGAACAIATTVALIGSGWPWTVAAAILLIWLGSLWLSSAKPPRSTPRREPSPFSRDNVEAVLALSASPQLLTENGKVVVVNEAARQIIGAHVAGQDARVAFRHPEAIELLNSEESGVCTIRNFARPQDCWQMRRQIIDERLALIELADRTVEVVVERAHTDFVANASHELRTPLAAIIGYVETLREGDGAIAPATADRFLSHIHREARRLQDLVSDLMSLSRVEAEKHDAPSSRLALANTVRRAAMDAAGPDRAARLDLSLDSGVLVAGDEPQLEQLVRNLVDNSLKYAAEGGRVRVGLTADGTRYARLTVADEGAGIAKEHLPHLTRRFYRTDPGRSRTSGGTGLGLAIVKHIVERHRGKLDISSQVGVGTTVTVRLPMLGRTGQKDAPAETVVRPKLAEPG